MTTTKSLLSKKDREKLSPQAQIQKLRRIAVRAQKHADWMDELSAMYADDESVIDTDDNEAERAKSQAKANAAAEEMLAIAKSINDPRVAGF